ncbi:hypothetical protein [Pseudoflavitalea rhizosphaerae]|uniref:hypothetical protein n=1 Tax=Pseudoflavitalea rhizosphaerae TaxID=1884793 RepID=UPI000F8F202B|nr:hypothetical protein [Pseudoflavitalea rhizosphaerae]
MQQQPWIGKPMIDIVFILLPPFVSLAIIALFPQLFHHPLSMSDASWVILVLLIDVAHVYSTLYRTYFDPKAMQQQRGLMLAIPFIGFIGGVLAYSVSPVFFWRLLAYTAVFHFVRQQYGFMRVYSRKEKMNRAMQWIDKVTIYYATIYPLLFWHLKGPRNFNWFVENDFLYYQWPGLLNIFTVLYFLVILIFVVKELVSWVKCRYINIPKLAVIAGTLLSWYFGIVYYNGDLAFTLMNVVGHGIPYMALVWIYGQKSYTAPGKGTRFLKAVFSKYGVLLFLGIIFLLAFLEEGVWDIAVWKEHGSIFGTAGIELPAFNQVVLSFLVPLLALPQITHYILDGFIWKIRHDEFKWNSEIKTP